MLEAMAQKLLTDLVQIESITFHEEKAAKYLVDRLRALGFEAEMDECNNVVALLKGKGCGKRLMFLGHHDTVEVGDPSLWKHPPFSAEIEDGKLYGRGTIDEKGGIAAMLAATQKLLEENPQGLSGDILFVSSREETLDIETRGILHVLKQRELKADGCICVEPTSCRVILGQKGRCIVDIKTCGKATHGAAPEFGINAIEHMAQYIAEITQLSLPVQAPLGRGTQCIGTIKGGVRANMVAADCAISIDRRTVSGETLESVKADYEQAVKRVQARIPDFHAEISIRPPFYPALIDESEEIVGQVKQSFEALGYPYESGYVAGHSDIEWIVNDAKIPSITLGPGDIGVAHSADEYVPLDELAECAEIYYTVMKQMLI